MLKLRVVALILVNILFSSAAAGAATARAKMVIAYASIGPRVSPLWAAEEFGFFRKNGIEPQLIFVRGAPTLVAALTSGDMDIGYTGGTAVLGAAAAGIDLKILAVLTNRVTYDLVARPGIKSAEDLRGKRFGVTSIGGTLWMGGVLGLEKLGVDSSRDDIKFLVIGDQVILSQALEDNRIDATVLDIVFSKRLAQKGFPILAELHKTNLPITSTSIVARQSYMQKNPQLMENFLKSVLEGIAFVSGPPNKAATLKLLQRCLRVSEREAEEGFVDMSIGMDKKPFPSMAGLRNIQRLMQLRNPKLASIKVEDLVDDQILRRLDESGFIDRLFAAHGVK
ncbi:MAG: ABC transporter substrate-binding protein [Deltaproteobacteria bacterium]|nr:ABC transporter substrate-binding protein [Deltaproteobacteria bacterium]